MRLSQSLLLEKNLHYSVSVNSVRVAPKDDPVATPVVLQLSAEAVYLTKQ